MKKNHYIIKLYKGDNKIIYLWPNGVKEDYFIISLGHLGEGRS